jgi:hypothetical protein
LRATDGAKVAERRDVDRPELGDRGVDPDAKLVECARRVRRREWVTFRAKRGELFGGQTIAAGVRE